MGSATLGLLVLLSIPVALALVILGLRLHNRFSASRASQTEFLNHRGSHDELRRGEITRAQHSQGANRG